jgi:hypothetical protein
MYFEGHQHSEESKNRTRDSMKEWWIKNKDSDKVKNRNKKIGDSCRGIPRPKYIIDALMEGRKKYIEKHGHPCKGKICWSKGLTKETDKRVKIQSEKLKKYMNENKHTEKMLSRNEKLSKKLKGKTITEDHKNKQSKTMKTLYQDGKITTWNKGLTKEIDARVLINQIRRGITIKEMWKDPNSIYNTKDYRKKFTENLKKHPSKPELKFTDIFNRNIIPLNYCGNKLLIIGGWNPDYAESNGHKMCVEVSNKTFRKKFCKIEPEEYERQRIEHFAKYGWKCLVLWDDELKDEQKLVDKVNSFLGENRQIFLSGETLNAMESASKLELL